MRRKEMKLLKKQLGILCAGIMAVSSIGIVPVVATTVQHDWSADENQEGTIEFTGQFQDESGHLPENQLQVIMPVEIPFTVLGDGTFEGGSTYTVVNNSVHAVDVKIKDFDNTNTARSVGINLLTLDELQGLDKISQHPRTDIALRLKGKVCDFTTYDGSTDDKIADTAQQAITVLSGVDLIAGTPTVYKMENEYDITTTPIQDNIFLTVGAEDAGSFVFEGSAGTMKWENWEKTKDKADLTVKWDGNNGNDLQLISEQGTTVKLAATYVISKNTSIKSLTATP
jgi:hypothetical protein